MVREPAGVFGVAKLILPLMSSSWSTTRTLWCNGSTCFWRRPPSSPHRRPEYAAMRMSACQRGSTSETSNATSSGVAACISGSRSVAAPFTRHGVRRMRPASTATSMTMRSTFVRLGHAVRSEPAVRLAVSERRLDVEHGDRPDRPATEERQDVLVEQIAVLDLRVLAQVDLRPEPALGQLGEGHVGVSGDRPRRRAACRPPASTTSARRPSCS